MLAVCTQAATAAAGFCEPSPSPLLLPAPFVVTATVAVLESGRRAAAAAAGTATVVVQLHSERLGGEEGGCGEDGDGGAVGCGRGQPARRLPHLRRLRGTCQLEMEEDTRGRRNTGGE